MLNVLYSSQLSHICEFHCSVSISYPDTLIKVQFLRAGCSVWRAVGICCIKIWNHRMYKFFGLQKPGSWSGFTQTPELRTLVQIQLVWIQNDCSRFTVPSPAQYPATTERNYLNFSNCFGIKFFLLFTNSHCWKPLESTVVWHSFMLGLSFTIFSNGLVAVSIYIFCNIG